ncbi:MAG: rod shape-determining protein MreC [Patescibacteria group bacterium]
MRSFIRFFGWLIILGLVFFVLNRGFSLIANLVQSGTGFVLKPFINLSLVLTKARELERQNQELKNQTLVLKEKLSEQVLNQNLTELYQPEGIQAKVIGFVLGSGGKRIFLDQGSVQGIQPGDWALISEKTLVGQVESVSQNYSVVKTIFDPSLKVAAEIVFSNGSIGRGLFYFTSSGFALDFLPKEFELAPDQLALVQSSGRDGIFRAGFYLGQALSLEDSTEFQLKKAVVEPGFNLNDLRAVFLVKNFFKK